MSFDFDFLTLSKSCIFTLATRPTGHLIYGTSMSHNTCNKGFKVTDAQNDSIDTRNGFCVTKLVRNDKSETAYHKYNEPLMKKM